MTDYNKNQMEKILEDAGIKNSPDILLEFPGLNRFGTSDHKFEISSIRGGASPKITGGYKYKDTVGEKKYFFTLRRNKLETKEIQCW